MQKNLITILVLLIGLFSSQQANASHGVGGEVSWTCLPSGQFTFHLKFYRDCNGINGPASVNLSTTVPGVPSILLTLYAQNDISPDGFLANGTSACPTCQSASGGTPVPGLVEEFVYQSAPVNLNGIPPANGWIFSWGECCRSSAITNITGAGGVGFQNRAIMYPYQGTNTQPCFDSSPYFAERPSTIICAGNSIKYSSNAIDPEMDSLVYSWGNPLTDAGAVIPFAPGYSVNSQLPSPTQNPLNVAATLHPTTGEINFTSFTGGYFVTVVKVTAYKCGIKVAEVFREIIVVLNIACPPVLGIDPNGPPLTIAPFTDPVTGLQTSYTDTVYAGDTVNFTFLATDFDVFLNGGAQTVTVSGSGAEFGANFTDPNSGCILPPCAIIAPGLPTSFYVGGQVDFNWVTTCAHTQGVNPQCLSESGTYIFILKATDNYCPGNATALATISITVLPVPVAVTVSGPPYNCLDDTLTLIASGAQSYTWSNGATGDSIVITQPGSYSVTANDTGSCAGTSVPFIFAPGVNQNVTASANQSTLCIYNQPATLTGSPAGGTWSGPGISGNMFDPSAAGAGTHSINYTVTDSLGCTGSNTLTMIVYLCTGLNETDENSGITIYPNPANEKISVLVKGLNKTKITIELYNVYGQRVIELYEEKILEDEWEQNFDISILKAGVYFFRVNGGSLKSGMFVKQ